MICQAVNDNTFKWLAAFSPAESLFCTNIRQLANTYLIFLLQANALGEGIVVLLGWFAYELAEERILKVGSGENRRIER